MKIGKSMKNEFVSYEIALALKELRFNKSCLGYYNIDPYLKNPSFNLSKPFKHEWCLLAPLYQQCFRFFREKFGLYSEIRQLELKNGNEYGYYIRKTKSSIIESFKTYEKAELACLKKLIEIVKTKQL